MNLEESIKDVISQKLEDGTVEKLVAQELEKSILNALNSLFRSYGDVTKVIEDKVKSVMIPYIEGYDFSKYITKLDSVLVDVLKNSALENKNLLENFKDIIITPEKKTIKASELFNMWKEFVAKNVNTDDLEIDYDDGVSYSPVEVTMEIEDTGRDWGSFENKTLIFECRHDEKMNFAIRLSRWKERNKKDWDIRYDATYDLASLRRLNSFEILLMNLTQNYIKLELDTEYDGDDITPEKEPEASFS